MAGWLAGWTKTNPTSFPGSRFFRFEIDKKRKSPGFISVRFDSRSCCLVNFSSLRSFVDTFRSIYNRCKLLCVLQYVQSKFNTFSMLSVLFADFWN